MGDIHYVKDVPKGTLLLDDPSISASERHCIIDPTSFERLGNYTQSMPTGASPGRIYKKNLGWPKEMDDNWIVYLVTRSEQEGYVDHNPYKALLLEMT